MIEILNRNHFKAHEFIDSNTAKVEGIDNNIYDSSTLANMSRTADKAEELRTILNKPIKINSGYRCLKLNRLLGSKDTSQHILGQAIDFICPQFGTPEEIIHFLKDKIEVDQCLMEGSWIHLSIREYGANRNEFAYFLEENGKRVKNII